MSLKGVIEGILFIVGKDGVTSKELSNILEIKDDELNKLLDELEKDYKQEDRGLVLDRYGTHLKLTTKKEHSAYYSKFVSGEVKSGLTSQAIEVLAIIAYNPDITRIKIDEIRGVNSTYIVRKLLIKGLIKENGKSDLPGKPNMYRVTDEFLDYLGISSFEELPDITLEETKEEETDLFNSKYKETEDN